MKTRTTGWCFGLAAWLALSSLAAAQDSPLELFTPEVDVLLRLKEPDRAVEGVVDLIDAVQPGAGAVIEEQAAEVLGRLISNSELTGVDNTRDWYAGVYSDGLNEPNVVFAIPAVDAAEMKNALGQGMTTRIAGTWVLYTESGSIPAVEQGNASSSMSEAAAKLFRQGTVGAFVNVSRLTTAYADQIETGHEQTLEALNQLRFMMPQQQAGIDLNPIIEMYGNAAEGFFRGLKDAKALTISVNVDEKGMGIDELLEFQDGTATREFVARQTPSAMSALAKLPESAVIYYGLSGAMKDMMKWGTELSLSMVQGEESKRKMTEAMKPLDSITFGPVVSAIEIGKGGDSGMFIVSAIGEVQPMDTYKSFAREASRLMGTLEFQGFKQETSVEADAEEFGDVKGDIVTTRQEYDEALDPTGMQEKMQALMFGTGGMQTRTVYLKDRYLSTVGGGTDQMRKLVDRVNGTATTALPVYEPPLQEQRNLLAYLDLPTMFAKGLGVAAESGALPIPIDENMIGNLNLKPSYIGFAIGTEAGSVRCETRIPAEQFSGLAKIGVLLFALSQQAGQL